MSRLRSIFMGTPAFAVPALEALHESEHIEIVQVWTQPPRPAKRGLKVQISPVAAAAQKLGLEIYTPASIKSGDALALALENLSKIEPDAAMVVAYGNILPSSILDCFPFGAWNLHASLLPRWRGAAPIQRAIEAGDSHSGCCVMRMEAGLDTGPIAATVQCPITPSTTAEDLHDELASKGAALLADSCANIKQHQLKLVPQEEALATYANKILSAESRLDFDRSCRHVQRLVNALWPKPVAKFVLQRSDELPAPQVDSKRQINQISVSIKECCAIPDDNQAAHTRLSESSESSEPSELSEPPPLQTGRRLHDKTAQPCSKLPGVLTSTTEHKFMIRCQDGWLSPRWLKRAGGRWMAADEFVNGLGALSRWRAI